MDVTVSNQVKIKHEVLQFNSMGEATQYFLFLFTLVSHCRNATFFLTSGERQGRSGLF